MLFAKPRSVRHTFVWKWDWIAATSEGYCLAGTTAPASQARSQGLRHLHSLLQSSYAGRAGGLAASQHAALQSVLQQPQSHGCQQVGQCLHMLSWLSPFCNAG